MGVVPQAEYAARKIVAWRREQLVASGYPLRLAASLASNSRFDLHRLIELAERGCPPELAVRIVAPLDWEDAA